MLKVNFLKVFHGDAIHISYTYNGKKINILIDSGPEKAYEQEEQTAPRDIIDGEFKNFINNLEGKINLVILTHVDDDHIGGVLKWMESEEFNCSMIEKVWFNSGQLIAEYFNRDSKNTNVRRKKLNIFKFLKTSIPDGVDFEDKLEKCGIWDRKVIKAGDKYNEFGANFLILSPLEKNLERLLEKWKDEVPDSVKTARTNDYKHTLKELVKNNETFYDSSSVHNGSSIAFILEVQGIRLLFLGDCFHTTIVESMKKLKINSIKVDLVKVSHHGSRNNTSEKLLDKIHCNKYVISTDGSKYNHPDKITIARIIEHNPNCEIYFNYKEELEKTLFKSQDYKDFNFTIHSTKDLMI